jgi:hypothetical protein
MSDQFVSRYVVILRIAIIFVGSVLSFNASANTENATSSEVAHDGCAVTLGPGVSVDDLQIISDALNKKNYRVTRSSSKALTVAENCDVIDFNYVCKVSVKIFDTEKNSFERNQFRMVKTNAEIDFEKTSRRLIKRAIKGFKACVPHSHPSR